MGSCVHFHVDICVRTLHAVTRIVSEALGWFITTIITIAMIIVFEPLKVVRNCFPYDKSTARSS